jgi:ATP-dependent RNA circularization protein (DNA/RNA ligase family)
MKSQRNVSAADIAKGTAENEGVIQGISQTTEERGVMEEANIKASNTEDVSTIVNSGTSLTEPTTIDKADIHSDDVARHIEKAQEKLTERVVDKETGSWKIKEKDDEEQ